MATLAYRIPESAFPPVPARGYHEVRVRPRTGAGPGKPTVAHRATPVEIKEKRQNWSEGRWNDVDPYALSRAVRESRTQAVRDGENLRTSAEDVVRLRSQVDGNYRANAEALRVTKTLIEQQGDDIRVVSSDVTALEASLADETNTRATAVQTLEASVTRLNGETAAVARWSVKLSVNDLVGGVGLYNDGATVEFIIAADKFNVVPPGWTGGSDTRRVPFAIRNGLVYLDNAVILNASITSAKIGSAQIGTTHIDNEAITTPKLRAGAIDTGRLAVGAVDSSQLRRGAIGAEHVQSGSIETHHLDAGSVTADKIRAGVVPDNFSDLEGLIGSADIAAGAIIAGKLASNSVYANNIRAGAVTASKVAAGVIPAIPPIPTSFDDLTGFIDSADIEAGAIIAGKLGVGAVQAINLASNSIEANKIKAGAIIADKIGGAAVDTLKLAANAATQLRSSRISNSVARSLFVTGGLGYHYAAFAAISGSLTAPSDGTANATIELRGPGGAVDNLVLSAIADRGPRTFEQTLVISGSLLYSGSVATRTSALSTGGVVSGSCSLVVLVAKR